MASTLKRGTATGDEFNPTRDNGMLEQDSRAQESLTSNSTSTTEDFDFASEWPNDQGVRCDCSLFFLTGDNSLHQGKLDLIYEAV